MKMATLMFLLLITTVNASTITYEYDTLGRLVIVSDGVTDDKNYTYDDAGNRKKMTVGNGNASPVASPDSITLSGLYSPKTINVLVNDSDPDGDTLTITNLSYSSLLSISDMGNGNLTVTAVGFKQPQQSFTYTISDSKGGTDTATVSVTVQ
tara:strand:+ start:756 stop:1211 length:456 start_codon:yes stop_codon:yes gene_type:complete